MKNFFRLDMGGSRIFGLDVMRAVAIVLVLVYHSIPLSPFLEQVSKYLFLDGVTIFFVLSGFLIGQIILKTFVKNGINRNSLLNFWIRRWFRTLPNYFLFLTVLIILYKLFVPGFPLRGTIPYFTFSQNLFSPIKLGFFIESWSLCVEEWFYLMLPILLLVLNRFMKINLYRSIIICASLFILLSFIVRIITGSTGSVITRMDSIMFGVIGSLIYLRRRNWWLRFKSRFFAFGLILLFLAQMMPFVNTPPFIVFITYYPLINLSFALMLPMCNETKTCSYGFLYKAITYMSLISYSLYLINFSLIKKLLLDEFLNQYLSLTFQFFIFWILSISGSIIIYKYFEMPMTKLRDKIKI